MPKAVEILHSLLEEKLICHASGDDNLPFNNGFYLFTITPKHTANNDPEGQGQSLKTHLKCIEFESNVSLGEPEGTIHPTKY